MESKRPTGKMAGEKPDPGLPRLCIAPWSEEEDRAFAEELCPDGCMPGGCALAVDQRRWPATGWDRELTSREWGALRRSTVGGWTAEDKAVVEALCEECESCGCSMDMAQLVMQHMTRDTLACPGFCIMAPPRMFRDRRW